MAIRVYNSLSRKKEEFVRSTEACVPFRVRTYAAGPDPHGHAKTYVGFDIVARYLRHKGYHVFYLQNVTDIEDASSRR